MTKPDEKSVVMQTLIQAIKERQCVRLRYRDQNEERVIEPHAIYIDEQGEMVLDAFQVGGYSESGRPLPYWRPLRLKKIRAPTPLKLVFDPRVRDGFSQSRLKYKNGLLAVVETLQPAFGYIPPTLEVVGPPRPPAGRR